MTSATPSMRLRLYLTGRTVSAERARQALIALEKHAAHMHSVTVTTEIVDVLDQPEDAAFDGIFATPTLMRIWPGPSLRLFGDLSCTDKLMAWLGFEAAVADPPATGEDGAPWPQSPLPSDTFSSPAAARE